MANKPETIDAYLAQVSDDDKRQALADLRKAIQAIVPDAEEGFSYGLPAFRLDGRPLMAFAATKNGCSLYPMSSAVIVMHAADLNDFETSKGTIRFLPDKPLPEALLGKLIQARIDEIRKTK